MQSAANHLGETGKTMLDIGSIGVVFATLASWLPPLAAGAALVWTVLRIWEIVRVRGWWKRRDE